MGTLNSTLAANVCTYFSIPNVTFSDVGYEYMMLFWCGFSLNSKIFNSDLRPVSCVCSWRMKWGVRRRGKKPSHQRRKQAPQEKVSNSWSDHALREKEMKKTSIDFRVPFDFMIGLPSPMFCFLRMYVFIFLNLYALVCMRSYVMSKNK